jgi:hypothetical protein
MLYKIYFDTNSEIESIGVDFEDSRKKYAGSYPPHGATDKERYDMRMATFKEGKMKLTRKQLRSLINESLDYLSPEDKSEAEREQKIEDLLLSSEIPSAALFADARGDNFSQIVRDVLKQTKVLDPEEIETQNELSGLDEVIRMISYRALNKFGLAKFNPEYGYFEISPELEEVIGYDIMSEIDENMTDSVKENILNAIENAVVDTVVAFAEVEE